MNRTLGYGVLLAALAAGCVCPARAAYSFSGAPGHTTQAPGGYLGVDLRDLTDEQVNALHQRDTRGAEIVLVDHDAPAGKAGLREHDIVLRINGQSISNQDQARHILHDCAPQSAVVLFISREGQLLTVSARMSTREEVERQAWAQHITPAVPQDPAPAPAVEANDKGYASPGTAPTSRMFHGNAFIGSLLPNSVYTGVMLEQLNTQLAQFFGASGGTGLLVRSVVDNSPAAVAGIHAGDVVVRVDGHAVASTGDWAKAVKNSHGHALSVVVLRDKKEENLTLTPDAKHRSSLQELIEAPERTVVAHLNRNWLPRT